MGDDPGSTRSAATCRAGASARWYAHTLPPPATCDDWEPLEKHLNDVAILAAHFTSRFGAAEWGRLAGLWHDLGKYSEAFQAYLKGRRSSVPHAPTGAALAAELGGAAGLIAAFTIAGHHAGLADRIDLEGRLLVDGQASLTGLRTHLPQDIAATAPSTVPHWLKGFTVADADMVHRRWAFFGRMLFSALVDADRLATACFYARAEGCAPDYEQLEYDDLDVLRARLDRHIDSLSTVATPSVARLRAEVLEACRVKSVMRPGLFSLTVPTGGGKTLSGMSFALNHAVHHNRTQKHGFERVIVVIPFTSIIEQNAREYRRALNDPAPSSVNNVLEHHSGIDEQKASEEDPDRETRRQLATENWDAPVVVTTTVQFFESLFSNHPSRCRKLHRIARSVVILDEVQSLPPKLLLPILDALRELTAHYGCTVVLSTATPPALAKGTHLPQGLTGIEPIIENAAELASNEAARRVAPPEWRIQRETPYDELASELVTHRQVLAIVHRRLDARELAELLPSEGRYHLSALMCPAHRLAVIDKIKRALDSNEPCRTVSTQLIEAGVNLDFPVVYRALCGLDSLAQSAGRCNREGKLGPRGGRFIVFRAPTQPPPGLLRQALETVEALLQLTDELDPFNPDHCTQFFAELYRKSALDSRAIQTELAGLNFATVADRFRMIENGGMRSIAVPWGDGSERIRRFLDEADRFGQPSRAARRALQPFLVQVNARFFDAIAAQGVIEPWQDDLGLPTPLFGNRYSEEFGLNPDPAAPVDPEPLCGV